MVSIYWQCEYQPEAEHSYSRHYSKSLREKVWPGLKADKPVCEISQKQVFNSNSISHHLTNSCWEKVLICSSSECLVFRALTIHFCLGNNVPRWAGFQSIDNAKRQTLESHLLPLRHCPGKSMNNWAWTVTCTGRAKPFLEASKVLRPVHHFQWVCKSKRLCK